MDQDPKYTRFVPKLVISDSLIPLWIKALDSKNIPMQRKAAESIVIAKQRGFKGTEGTLKVLLTKFGDLSADRKVKIAIAKAIVAVQGHSTSEDAASRFLEVAKSSGDVDLHSVIQPALAQWKYAPAKEYWNGILQESDSSPRSVIWAIEGLTALQDLSIVERLNSWVEGPSNDYRIRYSAAKALGKLAPENQVPLAVKLKQSSKVSERILALHLLQKPSVTDALPVCLELAKDPDSGVCVLAWDNLLKSSKVRELDSLIEFGLKHREPKVRNSAVEVLKLWKTEEACTKLGEMLSDLHPMVRNNARQGLLAYSKSDELKPAVQTAAVNRLAFNWEGIQQGLLIITELDYKPAALKIVDLVDHPRPEVHITAGWSLERLSVAETLPPVLQFTERRVTRIKGGEAGNFTESQYESLGHLIQLLGKNKYKDIEKVIVPKLIPKDQNIINFAIRPAAIWSLGQIYGGKTLPKDYQDKLVERLIDETYMDEESHWVKQMCAYTLGVTKCKETIPNLERYAGPITSPLPFYCDWALNQIDGRPIPTMAEITKNEVNWFLSPLD